VTIASDCHAIAPASNPIDTNAHHGNAGATARGINAISNGCTNAATAIAVKINLIDDDDDVSSDRTFDPVSDDRHALSIVSLTVVSNRPLTLE
jgi:hypothetical protein